MIEILTQLHQYIPQSTYFEERQISNGMTEKIEKANMRQILFGGDQLTAARARSSIKAKMNHKHQQNDYKDWFQWQKIGTQKQTFLE